MKDLFLTITLLFAFLITNAQQTAMQFTGQDCNSNNMDLFADLNAGKAVILFYYMPNCGACPPPATKIQTMANHILANHPGLVKGYAYPFDNTTTCTYSASWVTNNALSFYTPMDSGATQVAYYGGFGMPSVVLVGGSDHRVMFFTMSFATSDTTTMRDSILNLIDPAGIHDVGNSVTDVSLFPNPASDKINIELNVVHPSEMKIEVIDILGEVVTTIYDENALTGSMKKEIETGTFANGTYFIRISAENTVKNFKFSVAH